MIRGLYTSGLGMMKETKRLDVIANNLANANTVNDLSELFQVMESDSLSEFQYVIEDGEWKVVLK